MGWRVAVTSIVLGLLVAGGVAVGQDEQEGVRKPLNLYLLAHATGKGEYILQGFSPDAQIKFVREGKFTILTRDEFAARFNGKPADDEAKRKRRIAAVEITGNAATAKIVLDYPGVTLTDYMSLLKIDGEWKIVNKIFNAQPQPSK
jgi:hypothetical protein